MFGEIDRTRRVGELIRRELAEIISRDMADPRVRLVSITGVKVSRDLKLATVYVSAMRDEENMSSAAALNHAAGYLRRLLSPRMNMKNTPALRFQHDPTLANGAHMSHLIDEIRDRDRHLNDGHNDHDD